MGTAFFLKKKNADMQGRANPGVQGVPCTRAAEIKGRQFFFYVWQSSISVLWYGAAFITLHQRGITTGRSPDDIIVASCIVED